MHLLRVLPTFQSFPMIFADAVTQYFQATDTDKADRPAHTGKTHVILLLQQKAAAVAFFHISSFAHNGSSSPSSAVICSIFCPISPMAKTGSEAGFSGHQISQPNQFARPVKLCTSLCLPGTQQSRPQGTRIPPCSTYLTSVKLQSGDQPADNTISRSAFHGYQGKGVALKLTAPAHRVTLEQLRPGIAVIAVVVNSLRSRRH